MNKWNDISCERYEEIKEIIADMYEDLGYTELPVNVYELCHKLNIKLIRYSSLTKELKEYAEQLSKDGFFIFYPNTMQYEIFYDDSMPAERIKFTIMHEIAHITLEHKDHNSVNEAEANFFTKTALAPLGLIYLLKLKNSDEVAETFGISREFAVNTVHYFNNSMKYPYICQKEATSRLAMLFYNQYVEAG